MEPLACVIEAAWGIAQATAQASGSIHKQLAKSFCSNSLKDGDPSGFWGFSLWDQKRYNLMQHTVDQPSPIKKTIHKKD